LELLKCGSRVCVCVFVKSKDSKEDVEMLSGTLSFDLMMLVGSHFSVEGEH